MSLAAVYPLAPRWLLAHLGIFRSQADLAQMMGTQRGVGTPASNITRLASEQLDVIYTSGSLDDIATWLNRDAPTIVFVQAGELSHWYGEQSHHALVVVGIEARTVHVLDPAAESGIITVPQDDFLLAWDERDYVYAVITRRP
jgi:ABC-type bacteriocin/lantibiotic exporter with double-glycine peptidase domain